MKLDIKAMALTLALLWGALGMFAQALPTWCRQDTVRHSST